MNKNILIFINLFVLSNILMLNSAQRNLNYLFPLTAESFAETPLLIAILKNDLNKVKEIFEETGDIEQPNRRGNTGLSYAVTVYSKSSTKSLDIINFLLKNGADVTKKNIMHENPIKRAMFHGLIDVLIILLNKLDISNDYIRLSPKDNQIYFDEDLNLENYCDAHVPNNESENIKTIFKSYIKFKEEKKQNIKLSLIDQNLKNFMPKELIGIINQYEMETFQDYLDSNNLHFN